MIRNRARAAATLTVALCHITFFFLDVTGLLEFTVLAKFNLVMGVASHPAWGPLFLITGIAVLATMRNHRWVRYSLSFAFAVMGVWAFFTLLWGLYPIRAVSLVGPVLGIAIASISQILALSYTETEKVG